MCHVCLPRIKQLKWYDRIAKQIQNLLHKDYPPCWSHIYRQNHSIGQFRFAIRQKSGNLLFPLITNMGQKRTSSFTTLFDKCIRNTFIQWSIYHAPLNSNVLQSQVGSSGGVVDKLLACRARGPGLDSRSCRYYFRDWLLPALKQKQKYSGMFEIQKSGDKTSSGEIDLIIRTLASPKVGQDQVSEGVSVLCWHAAPVANVLWKPLAIR